MVDLGFGLGVMYAAGDDPNDFGNDGAVIALIMNKEMEPSAAFALKVSLSFTYFITDMIGAGIYFDYNCAFKTLDYDEKVDLSLTYHSINPGVQIVARF